MESEEMLEVGLSTQPGDDAEVVVLYPTAEVPVLFEGEIGIQCGEVEPHNGRLDVSHGDIITAEYYDADDGLGEALSPAFVEDSALVDIQPPEFGGLAITEGQGCYVRLAWDAAGEPHGPVMYNVYRGTSSGGPYDTLVGRTWTLSWTDELCPAEGTFYFNVNAEDVVGNVAENEVEGEVTIKNIYLPVISR
jgi:hypothetical protein